MPTFQLPSDTSTPAALAARLAALEADNLRLRAAVMQRDSALAFARQDREALAASVPGLPRRAELARRVEALGERLQSLMRERAPPVIPIMPMLPMLPPLERRREFRPGH